MALELRTSQQLRLSQDVIMTPQLQLAIKLLQLSQMDLVAEVRKELLENPVLEEEKEFPADDGAAAETPNPEEPAKVEALASEPANAPEGGLEDMKWDEYFDYTPLRTAQEIPDDDDRRNVVANITHADSLQDHLLEQLHSAEMTEEEERIAQFIIMCLDDNGFLTQSVDEIAAAVGFEPALVREILEEIKDFDPPGVGAADVRESLRLQAERLVGAPVLILQVLDKGFEHLERHRYDLIAKDLGVGLEEVKEAVEWIKSLEPRPGRRFGPDTTQYITPDVYVRKIDGEYVIQLNEDGMPKLRISAYYRGLMRNNGKGAEATTRRYINDKFKSAKWFIKSIHERQRTIFRVTESIMKFQRDFLDHGVSRLRPLILRDVADDIGMHESTVSRVTTNKYVHTPQGIYELKYFFKSHVAGESGDVSSEAVKDRIRKIVAAEDPKKPISDQAIAKMLDKEGVTIARRTVAKYRESLGIAQSALRKRLF